MSRDSVGQEIREEIISAVVALSPLARLNWLEIPLNLKDIPPSESLVRPIYLLAND